MVEVLYWHATLAYQIAPKSGPLRRMETLLDVNQALLNDLPPGFLRHPLWREVARRLVLASETGDERDIREATDAMAEAVEFEGWLSRDEHHR